VGTVAAHLVGIDARGLVPVMTVGDEQFGVAQRVLRSDDRRGIREAPEPVDRPVVIGRLRPGLRARDLVEGLPHRSTGIREQRENGGEVDLGRAREPEAVLLGARVRALVGTDGSRAVRLDPHSGKAAAPRATLPIRAGVVLSQRPQRRLLILHDNASLAPVAQLCGGAVVAFLAPFGEVDPHDVFRRAGLQDGTLLAVDDVIRGSDHVLQPAGDGRVVMQRAEGFDLGDCAEATRPPPAGYRRPPSRPTILGG
jgi:hypothetical protein